MAGGLADAYAQNSGELDGRDKSLGKYTPIPPGKALPGVSKPLKTWRGYAAAGSTYAHTILHCCQPRASHTHTHTLHGNQARALALVVSP